MRCGFLSQELYHSQSVDVAPQDLAEYSGFNQERHSGSFEPNRARPMCLMFSSRSQCRALVVELYLAGTLSDTSMFARYPTSPVQRHTQDEQSANDKRAHLDALIWHHASVVDCS